MGEEATRPFSDLAESGKLRMGRRDWSRELVMPRDEGPAERCSLGDSSDSDSSESLDLSLISVSDEVLEDMASSES
jgi:hypothetical protein